MLRGKGSVRCGVAVLTLLTPLLAGTVSPSAATATQTNLPYAPAPVDNPLKGLVPYATADHSRFPHSMEFAYLSLAELVTARDTYDWKPLEALLNEIAGRGRQAVVRVYLEYPERKTGVPAYLLKEGLKLHRYEKSETPDYRDPRLQRMLLAFIREWGRRYDGDPRLGFVTAGLLGAWGEWHTFPREDLFADKPLQTEVMNAFEAAFRRTPVLLRYPAGPTDPAYAPNDRRPLGYHDDSFAWATLETGKPEDSWFFLSLLRRAGAAAEGKWKSQPIGGEIRPEAWGKVFDAQPGDPQIQDFGRCVAETHASWLLDTGMFREQAPKARRERAEEAIRRMGYEFHIPTVQLTVTPTRELALQVAVSNRGIAPFYYDWPVEFGLLGQEKQPIKTFRGRGKITGLLPGEAPRVWQERVALHGFSPGKYRVLLRIPNPLPNGPPLRFANAAQDQDLQGWLTVGEVTLPP